MCHKNGTLLVVDSVAALGGVPFYGDAWGVDALYTGSQKCLSAPPGAAPLFLSQRAIDKLNARKTKVGRLKGSTPSVLLRCACCLCGNRGYALPWPVCCLKQPKCRLSVGAVTTHTHTHTYPSPAGALLLPGPPPGGRVLGPAHQRPPPPRLPPHRHDLHVVRSWGAPPLLPALASLGPLLSRLR